MNSITGEKRGRQVRKQVRIASGCSLSIKPFLCVRREEILNRREAATPFRFSLFLPPPSPKKRLIADIQARWVSSRKQHSKEAGKGRVDG